MNALPHWLNERDARERRRQRRALAAKLRAPLDAFGRWWLDFGRAMLPFALGFVACLPLGAGALVWAIEVWR